MRGIVLKSADKGERDKLLTVALANGAIVYVTAKGARAQNAKMRAQTVFLSFASFSLSESKAGYILSSAEPIDAFYNCWTDEKRNKAAVLCVELYRQGFKAGGETADFLQLCYALKEINYGEVSPLAPALLFFYKTANSLGIEPPTEISALLEFLSYEETAALDLSEDQIASAINKFLVLFKEELGIYINAVI